MQPTITPPPAPPQLTTPTGGPATVGATNLVTMANQRRSDLRKRIADEHDVRNARIITTEMLLNTNPAQYAELVAKAVDVRQKVQDGLAGSSASDQEKGLIDAANSAPQDRTRVNQAYAMIRDRCQGILNASRAAEGPEHAVIEALVVADLIGMSVLDPLYRDTSVESFHVDTFKHISITRGGTNERVRGCRFADKAHLQYFISSLTKTANIQLGRAQPHATIDLWDNTRIQLGDESIFPEGALVSARCHRPGFWTPSKLVDTNVATPALFTLLGNVIHYGGTVLLYGAPNCGKTTMLNALTGFFSPDKRIALVEKNTMEIRPHPDKMWITRARATGMVSTQRILDNIIIQSTPNMIVYGEFTDGDATFACAQAFSLGQGGMATMHANSRHDMISRFQQLIAQSGRAANAQDMMATAFDLAVHMRTYPDGTRRIASIDELTKTTDPDTGQVTVTLHQLAAFRPGKIVADPETGRPTMDGGTWEVLGEFSEELVEKLTLDILPQLTWDDLRTLAHIPQTYIDQELAKYEQLLA